MAFLTGVALQVAGGLGVAASPYSRRWRPEPHEPGTRRAGALATPGIRVLVLALALTAVALGVLEIGIAAFAEEHATRDDAGWLFALWSVGSLAGGLWYGAPRVAPAAAPALPRRHRRAHRRARAAAARRLDAGVRACS